MVTEGENVTKKTYTCPCGKTTKSKGGCINLGEFMKDTGWNIVASFDGEIIYMCPECYEKAVEFGEKIIELVGNIFCISPSLRGKYK